MSTTEGVTGGHRMKGGLLDRRRWLIQGRVFGWLLLTLTIGWTSWAQRDPRVGYVFPAGGRQGTTFVVKVGGQFLDGATNVYISGQGVRGSVLEHVKPLTQRQLNELRERLELLQKIRSGADSHGGIPVNGIRSTNGISVMNRDAVNREIAEIRKKLAVSRSQANPQIAETVIIQVVVSTNAALGQRELRLGTPVGISNPTVFWVAQLPEHIEQEPNDRIAGAGVCRPIPAILNGQILAGDVDRYRFQAVRGQRLVIAAKARDLIPFLADAVPGWFQALVTLYDGGGKEVASADDHDFHPDPVLCYEVPRDGDYVLEIRDALYRGREDFVYRLTVGELPFVTSYFPLGKRWGMPVTVSLQGWNLPLKEVVLEGTNEVLGIQSMSLLPQDGLFRPLLFSVDMFPESLEVEPNNQPSSAQRVTIPVILNGRVDSPGDRDLFGFEGKAGQEIVAEVYARRLNSPLDSVLRLTDSGGRELAMSDDQEDKGSGLVTHHADSWFRVVLPADGFYFAHIGDVQHQGGAAFGYRLRLSPPQPGFELRVVPSSVNTRPGGSVPISVYALRKDGFSGDIHLELKDSPQGFRLSGGWVPDHQDHVRLTLEVPRFPKPEPFRLVMEGRAMVEGREVRREAVPADDMMQAFFYHHWVPSKEWMVAVHGTRRSGSVMKLAEESPVRIPVGGVARVRVLAAGAGRLTPEPVDLEPLELPLGIVIRGVSAYQGELLIELGAEDGKIQAGAKGNIVVTAFVTRESAAKSGKPQRERRRIALGTVPAIRYEVIGSDSESLGKK